MTGFVTKMVAIDLDRVGTLIREAAETIILPRWRQLQPHEITEKAKGDFVTIADHEAEALLTAGLQALAPGVPVIGEEAAAANPALLQGLDRVPALWLVDPVDGTQNFVHGHDRFAVMIAYVVGGRTVASWIYLPATGKMAVAEAGSGAWIDGVRIKIPPAPPVAAMIGAAHIKRLPEPLRHQVAANLAQFAANRPAYCAGFDYVSLVEGARHFSFYYRTLPWDHAPGALLVREAGGIASRFDGEPYRPLDLKAGGRGEGLLSASDSRSWARVHDTLFSA